MTKTLVATPDPEPAPPPWTMTWSSTMTGNVTLSIDGSGVNVTTPELEP